MLRPLLATVMFVLAAAPAQTPVVPTELTAEPTPTEIVWHQDFATARTLAQKTGAPLLVTFRCEA